MLKEIQLNDRKVQYSMVYKNVKNINLRIKPDGSVTVSANINVSETIIEEFLKSKENFIIDVLDRFKNVVENTKYFSEDEIKNVILDKCKEAFPYYEAKGIRYPVIKFKKMISRWGSCHTKKGVLTFNVNLMYTPMECIEYVVHHEFTHFIVPNHSQAFYTELSKTCPEWKRIRNNLKKIVLK